jgi:hypothetical protein
MDNATILPDKGGYVNTPLLLICVFSKRFTPLLVITLKSDTRVSSFPWYTLLSAFLLISCSEFQDTAHDDAHDAFMTLPPNTRFREGEVP